jgi:WD40 repeat protein
MRSVLLGFLAVVGVVRGESLFAADEPVSFHRQIRPILQQKCQGCHQPARLKGELLLTSYDGAAKGGVNGPMWLAGKPDESRVIKHLKAIDKHALMPQGEEPLPEKQIELFAAWIKQGAKDDTPEQFKRTLVTQGPPTYTQPVAVTALAFSPDGSALAVAGYREVLLHKPDGSGLLGRLVGLSERIESIVFSPDGQTLLVAGGSAGRFGELQFWNWQKQTLQRSFLPSFDTLYGAAFSTDGQRVSFGCADNSARIIDAKTGKQLLRLDHHLDWVFGSCFTQDGKFLASASRDRTVKLCAVTTGEMIGNMTTLDPTQPSSSYRSLQRRPGRDECVGGGEDGVPRLFRLEVRAGAAGNLLRTYEKLQGRIEGLAFSADGSQLAAGGVGGVARVYNTDDARVIASFQVPSAVFALAFRPDGKQIALAGLDGKVRLYSLPDGKLVPEFIPVPLNQSTATKN